MVFLLHGEDSFRTRLRLGELATALLSGTTTAATDLSNKVEPRLGTLLGITRHDARFDTPGAIMLSGQSQGLFDAVDEARVVIVDHAEALKDLELIASFPREAALVLVSVERLAAGRSRRTSQKAKTPSVPAANLLEAVEAAGGSVERIERLAPVDVPAWISARARVHETKLDSEAVATLASAVGSDTERIEQEIGKLRAYAGDATVTALDVRSLVSGAIEADVFELTQAVVRKDARTAVGTLERLLDGNAVQQILALLVWQFRVLLFASAMRTNADAERMGKAIRSSPYAIQRATAFARRVTRSDVVRAYEALYATDQVIKTGRAESDVAALTLCVLDLCGVGNADLRDMLLVEAPRR
jgi:DNA polymerase III delta subunit